MIRFSPADAPVVSAALRTPIGTAGSTFARVGAAALAAPVLASLGRGGPVGEVVLGNCTGPGGDVARVAALEAGLPLDVPALTVDRQCGSGLAALEVAAAMVAATGRTVLAGGVESASTAPLRFHPSYGDEPPARYDRAPFAPERIGDPEMGAAAAELAEERGITRERQDAYAARSHQRAWATQERGGFAAEIVAVDGVARDARPRPGMTTERLARLRPAFGATVTAGNSCGINDGAAAVRLEPPGAAGLRVLAVGSVGLHPRLPGLGIVPAVEQVLEAAGVTLADVDVVELNEAFAGQVLACADQLGLEEGRICPEGGALALGHPWGASGAVLAVRLFSQLMSGTGRFGLAGIAVGGGQGVAMVVQACR